jgi:hypothetical protein
MYVVPGTLDGVIAYIDGLDLATGCLAGFREWLVTRFEDGDNLYWGGLFRMLLRNDSTTDDEAITKLGQTFCEFKEFVDSCSSRREGQLKIYLRYHAWLLNRPYYKPGTPWYIPPYDGLAIPKDSG